MREASSCPQKTPGLVIFTHLLTCVYHVGQTAFMDIFAPHEHKHSGRCSCCHVWMGEMQWTLGQGFSSMSVLSLS